MARLPRLAIAGQAHLVWLRGHNGQTVFADAADRGAFLDILSAACQQHDVALHAYALVLSDVWIVATPAAASGLSRAMQALGRRYSATFNRRHARSGSLWDGRYRAAVIEAGACTLEAMLFVDQALTRGDEGPLPNAAAWTSAKHHVGTESQPTLSDLAVYWSLGNTPFERAAAYRRLLEDPIPPKRIDALMAAVRRGWVVGSATFVEKLELVTLRPVTPQRRGRPRKVHGTACQ
jgi:putative transposase